MSQGTLTLRDRTRALGTVKVRTTEEAAREMLRMLGGTTNDVQAIYKHDDGPRMIWNQESATFVPHAELFQHYIACRLGQPGPAELDMVRNALDTLDLKEEVHEEVMKRARNYLSLICNPEAWARSPKTKAMYAAVVAGVLLSCRAHFGAEFKEDV